MNIEFIRATDNRFNYIKLTEKLAYDILSEWPNTTIYD